MREIARGSEAITGGKTDIQALGLFASYPLLE